MFSKKILESKEEINIVEEINDLINNAIKQNASDIHIEPLKDKVRIRYRVDGKLFTTKSYDLKEISKITTRIKIMSKLNVAEKRIPQDGGFKYSLTNRDVDIRVSTILTIYGEKIVLRILNKDEANVSLDKLGISKEDISLIRNISNVENGLIYLTGPTGCGKSTTLYSVIKELNKEDINIITVEDPVEFKIDGVNQIQINEAAGIGFSNTLKSILRQDPEIILVGETRDRETAEISVRAAITGHRVFSTLHTSDSYSAIIRLLDMNIDDYLIKASLKGVLSQRLIRNLCNNCKEKVLVTEEQKEILKNIDRVEVPKYIYKPVGCSKCNNGYLGRKAVMEILPIDSDFRNIIRKNIDLDKLRNLGREKNIKNLLQKALVHLYNGTTSFDELMNLSLNMEFKNGD
ncbi:GspE/PulE family protein [Miniphocaeibacter halophilus]|uniref:Type II/IV secretion system protein n=1 Tax=Miniphocaeibacter halophilus TaxID=2931922 RepID=A0AC61N0U5_9FIRM|nr:GspE/PulE family protein [Miniphocaeibacter halophilus]QQK08628.1 type II/IV secretion system protein [Miniphocaeibacter halophilus]